MKLEKLLVGNPEDVFLHLERKVNARFPLEKEFADVPNYFRPDLGEKSYRLPFVKLLSPDEVYYSCFSPDIEIEKEVFIDLDYEFCGFKFFVHPVMIQDYLEKGMYRLLEFDGNVEVCPTSSTRTVMTRGMQKNFMIKVNLERKLGENVRKLRGSQVEHSNRIMRELNEANLPVGFAYMPESIGAVYCISEEKQAGMIIREFQPWPRVEEKRFLVPVFSLFSLDKEDRESDPLLAQIIENVSKKNGCNELESFLSYVAKPFISVWAYFVTKRGLNPDIHAQNSLLELDENGIPARIVYRDFQEFFVNPDKREELGLKNDFTRHLLHIQDKEWHIADRVIYDKNERRKIHYSYTYENKIGRIFDYFSIVLSKFPSCKERAIQEEIKKIFKKNFLDLEQEYFPEDGYYMKPERHNFNKENLERRKPKYR